MAYTGPERRRSLRAHVRFAVSYRILHKRDKMDLNQTKNISIGGMLLTTNCKFPPGEKLALEIQLPFVGEPLRLIGSVLESKEIVNNLIYDTRITFLSVDKRYQKIINKTINFYLRRQI